MPGPGTALCKAMNERGMHFANCAREQAFFGMMNNWGMDTCRAHQQEIVAWVQEKGSRGSVPAIALGAEEIVETVLSSLSIGVLQ